MTTVRLYSNRDHIFTPHCMHYNTKWTESFTLNLSFAFNSVVLFRTTITITLQFFSSVELQLRKMPATFLYILNSASIRFMSSAERRIPLHVYLFVCSRSTAVLPLLLWPHISPPHCQQSTSNRFAASFSVINFSYRLHTEYCFRPLDYYGYRFSLCHSPPVTVCTQRLQTYSSAQTDKNVLKIVLILYLVSSFPALQPVTCLRGLFIC